MLKLNRYALYLPGDGKLALAMHTSAKLAVIFIEERVGKSPHVLAHHGAKIFLELALKTWDEHIRNNVQTSPKTAPSHFQL